MNNATVMLLLVVAFLARTKVMGSEISLLTPMAYSLSGASNLINDYNAIQLQYAEQKCQGCLNGVNVTYQTTTQAQIGLTAFFNTDFMISGNRAVIQHTVSNLGFESVNYVPFAQVKCYFKPLLTTTDWSQHTYAFSGFALNAENQMFVHYKSGTSEKSIEILPFSEAKLASGVTVDSFWFDNVSPGTGTVTYGGEFKEASQSSFETARNNFLYCYDNKGYAGDETFCSSNTVTCDGASLPGGNGNGDGDGDITLVKSPVTADNCIEHHGTHRSIVKNLKDATGEPIPPADAAFIYEAWLTAITKAYPEVTLSADEIILNCLRCDSSLAEPDGYRAQCDVPPQGAVVDVATYTIAAPGGDYTFTTATPFVMEVLAASGADLCECQSFYALLSLSNPITASKYLSRDEHIQHNGHDYRAIHHGPIYSSVTSEAYAIYDLYDGEIKTMEPRRAAAYVRDMVQYIQNKVKKSRDFKHLFNDIDTTLLNVREALNITDTIGVTPPEGLVTTDGEEPEIVPPGTEAPQKGEL